MARRGRPPHRDVLTPREWEVLELLREGLSNEEIGHCLGITERTARFHVSEILGKLGVSGREEAAIWSPTKKPWWMTALQWPVNWSLIAKLVGASLVAAAFGGAGLLAWGVATTESPPIHEQPEITVGPSGDVAFFEPRVDGVCEVISYSPDGKVIGTRADPCENLEGGGRACFMDEIDVPGTGQKGGQSCGTPSEGKVELRCRASISSSSCQGGSVDFWEAVQGWNDCEAAQRAAGVSDRVSVARACQ
jgi:DNA-binding CsgD family transcriptional regulator